MKSTQFIYGLEARRVLAHASLKSIDPMIPPNTIIIPKTDVKFSNDLIFPIFLKYLILVRYKYFTSKTELKAQIEFLDV